jgi:hypothetical protein
MTATSIAVDPATFAALPGATFGDAFRVVVDEPGLDAITATHRVMGRNPAWIARLMALRNALVAPLGLKPAPDEKLDASNSIGTFPLISASPERVILGLDDKHLDFRICVDVATNARGQRSVTATTLVKPHNWLGRAYLALVLPFHRIIVPVMLKQARQA